MADRLRERRRARRRRLVAQRKPRTIVRILCEGDVTEPEYLFAIAGANVVLDPKETGMSPKSLVDHAWRHVKKRGRRRSQWDFDEIWCVFDRDDHPDISGTLQTARDRKIPVAFSNPCFELWLVLHAEDQSAYIGRDDVQNRSEQLGLTLGKRINPDAVDRLRGGYAAAKERAKALDQMHQDVDSEEANRVPTCGDWWIVYGTASLDFSNTGASYQADSEQRLSAGRAMSPMFIPPSHHAKEALCSILETVATGPTVQREVRVKPKADSNAK